MAKKFVKEGPGAHQDMDATKDMISVLMLPFEGYCKNDYNFRVIFLTFYLWPSLALNGPAVSP